MSYAIRIDRHLIRPAGGSVRYALVSITAPEAPPKTGREPLHLALVLDRSGSMGGPKIVLAREAVRQALQALEPTDRFSLVAYDDQIDVVVESVKASAEARRSALAKLAQIDSRGSTDLHGGWAAGCSQLAAHLGAADVGRCLLLTDGLANVGIDEPEQLVSLAGAARREGRIATSTFGVGADFDERLLRGMADAAGGRFYFIEQPAQIPDLLTSELGELLQVVARDASLILQLPQGVGASPLNALETADITGGIQVRLGDLVSGQQFDVVVALKFPAGHAGDTIAVQFTLADRDGALSAPPQVIGWSYGAASSLQGQPRDRIVDRAVARLYTARARAEALELNREGRFREARARLEKTARRILGYAGDDEELRQMAEELRAEAADYSRGMDEMARKQRYFRSYSSQKDRLPDGKARR
ncbi:MAG TPA: VWA domain-containing protein [Vicinamibacterales bacterium]|nr:VWA domain-containing protein [Vicinamibacterales bacterium]HPK71351.1 VWA domain-containing protein [Vicinamibacterales bacterium]